LNSEICKKALEIVINPNVLVNLLSRRVRQLTNGGRPLISETAGLGWADIALMEIVDGRMSFELLESENGKGPREGNTGKKRNIVALKVA
jgi:DNA-directed RNA polymerase subunit omega